MKRIWQAFLYSIDGLIAAWKGERAFREEVLLSVILIPLAFFIAPNKTSLILMVGSLLLLIAVELLNTAVEAAIDRIGPEIYPLAKKAKDTASAAVLIMITNTVFVWCAILLG